MRKKILLTGGTGFIGRNILPILQQKYTVLAPCRNELDVVNKQSVDTYMRAHQPQVIIHAAASNPTKNPLDHSDTFQADILQGFQNIASYQQYVEKILYLGSGADMDKRLDMHLIKEEELGRSYPVTPYAIAKYEIAQQIRNSANMYYLRIFGCYGPTDAKTKFIRDAIDCCLEGKPISIRQNCMFDYMYVEDLAPIMDWFITHTPKYHDYNVCTGKPVSLLEIAQIIANQMGSTYPIQIKTQGWNKEYTADNTRLCQEMLNCVFTPLSQGVASQIKWQKGNFSHEKNG